MKKIFFCLIILAYIYSFADEFLNIYDAEGHLLKKINSLQEFNAKNCLERKCFVAKNNKKSTAKQYKKIHATRTKSNTRWYEVNINEGIRICPEKKFDSKKGSWIVNGTAYIDENNCINIDGSSFTRSILALFLKDPDDLTNADTNWVLVNQTIVELSKLSYDVWVPQQLGSNLYSRDNQRVKTFFSQDLIVDKTEFTIREAINLKKNYCKKGCNANINTAYYLKKDSLEMLDNPMQIKEENEAINYAKWRSERDALNNVFPIISSDSSHSGLIISKSASKKKKMILNVSESGYRMPFDSEWQALQSGGKNSYFFWGNDTSVSNRYVWNLSNPIDGGVRPVAKLAPNPFGLYDVYGNADELVIKEKNGSALFTLECNSFSLLYSISPNCHLQRERRSSRESKDKHICLGERCTAYIYRGMTGVRFVRKLE